MEIETAGKLPLFSSIIFLLEQKNDRGVSIVMFEYHRRWSYCIDWVLKAHVLVRLCILMQLHEVSGFLIRSGWGSLPMVRLMFLCHISEPAEPLPQAEVSPCLL